MGNRQAQGEQDGRQLEPGRPPVGYARFVDRSEIRLPVSRACLGEGLLLRLAIHRLVRQWRVRDPSQLCIRLVLVGGERAADMERELQICGLAV